MLNPFFPGGQGGGGVSTPKPSVYLSPYISGDPVSGETFYYIEQPSGGGSFDVSSYITFENIDDPENITYQSFDGNLPAGFAISPEGLLTTFGPGIEDGFYAVPITAHYEAADGSVYTSDQTYVFKIGEVPYPAMYLSQRPFTSVVEDAGGFSWNLLSDLVSINLADPVVFGINAGTVPPGFTLTPEGVFSGTADVAGDYFFNIQATSGDLVTSQSYFVRVTSTEVGDQWAVIDGGTSVILGAMPIVDQAGTQINYEVFRSTAVLSVLQSGWIAGNIQGGGAPGGDCTVAGRAGGGGGAGENFDFMRWFEAGDYNVQIAATAAAGSTLGNNTIITRVSDGEVILTAFGGSRGGNSQQAGVNNTNPGGDAGGAGQAATGNLAGGTAAAGRGRGGAQSTTTAGGGGGRGNAAIGPDGAYGYQKKFGTITLFQGGGGSGGGSTQTAGVQGGGGGFGQLGSNNGGNAQANTGAGGGGAGPTMAGRTGGTGGSGQAVFWVKV